MSMDCQIYIYIYIKSNLQNIFTIKKRFYHENFYIAALKHYLQIDTSNPEI